MKKYFQQYKLFITGTLAIFSFGEYNGQSVSKQKGDEQKNNLTELKTWKIPDMGEAAEAYFSPDSKSLVCNAKLEGDTIHQVYTLNIDGSKILKINGKGADACSYYFPDGKRIIFTSTKDHLDMHRGNYSKPNDYPQGAELYSCKLDGSDVKQLTNNKYYDAEVSVSPDGKWILFSRQIDGKLDLWKMHPDGTNEIQITHTGDWQEGGSFYMPDSKTILFRAWKREFESRRGMPMTIFTIKDDGTDLKQITHEDSLTNWAPHPTPDGKHFVFVKVLPPHNFEIFLMNIETGKQTQLTNNNSFDGFPVISPDGKLMTFSSGRGTAPGERKLFLYLMDVSSLNLGKKK